jgi:hypothetical protein
MAIKITCNVAQLAKQLKAAIEKYSKGHDARLNAIVAQNFERGSKAGKSWGLLHDAISSGQSLRLSGPALEAHVFDRMTAHGYKLNLLTGSWD